MNTMKRALIIFICILSVNSFLHAEEVTCQQKKRVAILIVRVGNVQAFSPMSSISIKKTDYSLRKPGLGKDVFIETDKRLMEVIPDYPKFPGYNSNYKVEFFKNISSEITGIVKKTYLDKGYDVVDLKKMSESWDKPYSEMSLGEIITTLKPNVDFLFILHYMDIGNSSVISPVYEIKASNSRFTSLLYTCTMLDIQKEKKIFSYTPITGLAVIPSLVYNPDIMISEDLRPRIKVQCTKRGSNNYSFVTHDFSDEELISILLGIIINGFECPKVKYIQCFDECNYYNIKSLKLMIHDL
jgi:hypothetical protein